MIRIKRVYEQVEKTDGYRILVDRLWPRGISKEKAQIDLWLKEIAPSTELRNWFNHELDKWVEFELRYTKELDEKKELVEEVRELEQKVGTISLLYGAKDTAHNNAIVLSGYIKKVER